MKSIVRLFNKIKKGNPLWSDHICLAKTVEIGKFSGRTIRKYFSKLVNKTDYDPRNKKEILKHLLQISQTSEKNTEDG